MFSRMMSYDQVYCFNVFLMTVGIKEYSEWPTIPQLYVKGEFVGGCDIVLNMHQSGDLEKVLEGAGVLVPIEEEAETPVGTPEPLEPLEKKLGEQIASEKAEAAPLNNIPIENIEPEGKKPGETVESEKKATGG
jgi:hypothetical protein